MPVESPAPATVRDLVMRAFLFTDVEGSSRLMEQAEAACKAALAQHDRILRVISEGRGGRELAETGDGFLFVFNEPAAALQAALEFQRQIGETPWASEVGQLRVRAALGFGEVTPLEGGEFRGLILNRTARLLAATHGGQTVCGKSFAEAVGQGPEFHELGWYQLRDLAEPEQVFQIQRDGTRQLFPPLRTTPVVPCNLPRSFTTFIGREKETASVCRLLRPEQSNHERIVTLTGPGGTGKTRLSLAIAEQLRRDFAEAAWFVPLADLADATLLPMVLRDALRLPADSPEEPLQQVAKFLAARPGLLVLDNFEQLLPEGTDVLVPIIREAPELRWLVSSRQRLGLAGETELPIGPLETPDPHSDAKSVAQFSAVQLFADRAKAARPNFELTTGNASVIADLCRKLEGVPLAIELAASRCDVVAPAEMLHELDERLTFCSSSDPNLPARHRSLRAAIDWSYNFLPSALRVYFENLSVFRGGWNVDAARAIAHSNDVTAHAGETRRALAELRTASLVRAEEVSGAMRFHMLETIRQYAAEKLEARPEPTEVRRRHATFFADLAERAEAQLHGAEAECSMSRLDLERENLRAALTECQSPELLARLSTALTPFWIVRGSAAEGRRWLGQCRLHGEAFSPRMRGTVLSCCGTLAVQQADWSGARESFLAALKEFRSLNDEQNTAALLSNLGIVAANQDDLQEARRWFAQSLEHYATFHHPTCEALAFINLGTVCTDLEEMSSAANAYARAIELSRITGDHGARALALHGLAHVEYCAGKIAEAVSYAEESLALNQKLKLQPQLAQNAMLLACIASKAGDHSKATRWLGAADWLTRETEALASLRLKLAAAELRARLRDELPHDVLAHESATGRRIAQTWCRDAG